MKRKFAVIPTIVLALCLVFILSGCSSTNTASSSDTSNSSSQSGVTLSEVKSKFKEHSGDAGPDTEWNEKVPIAGGGTATVQQTIQENTGNNSSSSDPYLFKDENTGKKYYICKTTFPDISNKNQTDYAYMMYNFDDELVRKTTIDYVENNFSLQDAN